MSLEIDLCGFFVQYYNQKKEKGEVFIPDTKVAKIIMIGMYNQFLRDEILLPIELLNIEEKMDLVNECRKMELTSYTNESLIINCKILHVINLINNNS